MNSSLRSVTHTHTHPHVKILRLLPKVTSGIKCLYIGHVLELTLGDWIRLTRTTVRVVNFVRVKPVMNTII